MNFYIPDLIGAQITVPTELLRKMHEASLVDSDLPFPHGYGEQVTGVINQVYVQKEQHHFVSLQGIHVKFPRSSYYFGGAELLYFLLGGQVLFKTYEEMVKIDSEFKEHHEREAS